MVHSKIFPILLQDLTKEKGINGKKIEWFDSSDSLESVNSLGNSHNEITNYNEILDILNERWPYTSLILPFLFKSKISKTSKISKNYFYKNSNISNITNNSITIFTKFRMYFINLIKRFSVNLIKRFFTNSFLLYFTSLFTLYIGDLSYLFAVLPFTLSEVNKSLPPTPFTVNSQLPSVFSVNSPEISSKNVRLLKEINHYLKPKNSILDVPQDISIYSQESGPSSLLRGEESMLRGSNVPSSVNSLLLLNSRLDPNLNVIPENSIQEISISNSNSNSVSSREHLMDSRIENMRRDFGVIEPTIENYTNKLRYVDSQTLERNEIDLDGYFKAKDKKKWLKKVYEERLKLQQQEIIRNKSFLDLDSHDSGCFNFSFINKIKRIFR